MAKGGEVSRTLVSAADIAGVLAILLALLAVTLAAMSWPGERRWLRVLVWSLAIGALLWSLLVV